MPLAISAENHLEAPVTNDEIAAIDAQLRDWWAEGWEVPAQLNPWQWAEEFIEFPDKNAATKPGKYNSLYNIYCREILEAFADPKVRRIVLCFSAQSAKTITMLVALCYSLVNNPGPCMWAMPSADLSREFSKMRLHPIINENAALKDLKTANRHDFGTMVMMLRRSAIFLQGANSPTQASSKGILNLFLDEVDKYKSQTTKEADALSNFLERVKDFDDHKVVISSTPTTSDGTIWRELSIGDFCKWHIPCPHCGHEFAITWPMVKFPDTDDYKRIMDETHLECPSCNGVIEQRQQASIVRKGRWIATNPDAPEHIRSFHIPEMVPTRWGKLAVKFKEANQKAKYGDTGPLHAFVNSSLAEPWEPRGDKAGSEEALALLCDDRPSGLVPSHVPIAGITAGVDTQDNGFYYVIRAWGYGLAMDSWLVRYGFIDSFDGVDTVLWQSRYADMYDKDFIINLALQDSQGHRTGDVYDFVRMHAGIRPTRGEQRMSHPWATTPIDRYPDTGNPIPGGVTLYRINTTHWKDKLTDKLQVDPADPGAFNLHSEVGADYFSQMTAEYRDENGIWQCPKHRANHYWDCEVLALAAADVAGIKYWQPEPDDALLAAETAQRRSTESSKRRKRRW